MKRHELEHVIRAAGAITQTDRIVVLGSQAILATQPSAPQELLVSAEVDLYPENVSSRSDLIDGSIGEMSPFHQEFGYYAHGVGPETAVLARGWRERLVPLANENTAGVTALCLHPLDIAVSKLAAGRDKDIAYVRVCLEHGIVDRQSLLDTLNELPPAQASRIRSRLQRIPA